MYWLLIFIVIICFHVSTSTLTSNSSAGRVKYLPGFQGPLPFYLETGYVGVGENEDVQLFYYFIQSESDPDNDPVMLWLSGGPGCSSISGLLFEIGPIEFGDEHYNGSLPTLVSRPNSWTKMASIIFLDLPVGTGFSYARTARASYSTDNQLCDHAYEFMRKWFESHPEFVSNPFYLGGDSYAGLPVTMITSLISDGNEVGNKPYINLKGYVLGNPLTFPEEDNYAIRFANGMGLISDELYKSLFHTCHGEYRLEYINTSNIECCQNLELYQKCIYGIQRANVLEPYCGDHEQFLFLPTQKLPKEQQYLSTSECRVIDTYELVYYWIPEAMLALHIRKVCIFLVYRIISLLTHATTTQGTVTEWKRCNHNLNYTITVYDVKPYHQKLSMKGYRSLIYSGDHDMIIPHQSTLAWVKDLNYSVIDQWRSWKHNGQIAGYTESYSNMMTFATVKGGGHTAPEYKPEECLVMFKRWISYQPL
ncbi:serine carboxypeptidase-like 13 [Bidens hawaiensis]|uniref:serine carboxypeptidase-like 13 n=1 Tax=Bidens hawaiensis TaxID=980011 RepID=UPI00404A66C1